MEFINATQMQTGYTLGMEPSGREYLVVVVKGTFTIPEDGCEPELAEQQVPLVEADTFTGEPGLSSTVYESDYWKNEIGPRVPEFIDRDRTVVTRMEPTGKSVLR